MVLDLKAGDAIRALGDVVRVTAVEDAGSRPVYHVQVAAGRGIMIGKRGILAHDERVAFPPAAIFDAATIDRTARCGALGMIAAVLHHPFRSSFSGGDPW